MVEQVTVTVNGRSFEARRGDLLIAACEDNGVYIPRFCWHRRMTSVGMCRMCLVEIEGPRGRMLTTSCTVRLHDDTVVFTESPTVKKAQEGVLEFLLINHPLDCPVCDRGGECPLQDQTMAYGPGESRFIEEKRHFDKPIPISDLVMLDRERCILCDRCTRFSDEISGDPLITFVDRGYGTQVLTFPDEPFASYFSGNTVQLCPVGALTATPYRFRARPWDLEAVESTCTTCSVGCRVSVQASQNEVVRLDGVDSEATNHGWLCDKGRFAFEYLAAPERIRQPLVRSVDGDLVETSWAEALQLVAERLTSDGSAAGLGGARGTNEEAYAFAKFMRKVLGSPHLDCRLGDGLDTQFAVGVVPRAAIGDLEEAAAVIVFGPDVKEELPVLYLRVRRVATFLGAKLIVVSPRGTGLDDVAWRTIRYRPDEALQTLEALQSAEQFADVREVLASGPVVALVGRSGLAESPDAAVAAAAWARTLPDARILPLVRRSNTMGALDMGVAPDLLPGRVSVRDREGGDALGRLWGEYSREVGLATGDILRALDRGELRTLVLVGADPLRDHPQPEMARRALQQADFVVALDLFLTDSSRRADVVLPVAAFAETEGTVTNLEGRVQKLNRVVPAPGSARPVWSILEDLSRRMGAPIGAESAEAVAVEIARAAPAYQGISWDDLEWGAGREGIVVPAASGRQPLEFVPTPIAADAASGDRSTLALHLGRVLYDDGVLVRMGPSLAKLRHEPSAHLHPDDARRLRLEAGDRVRVGDDGSSVTLPVVLDETMAPGTVYVPFNLEESAGLAASPRVTVEAAR